MKRIEFDAAMQALPPEMLLALDEALLLAAEDGEFSPTVRVWEFTQPTVVLGRSSKIDRETDRAFCDSNQIPIFRRCSGGASIVGGQGCLMYSLVLSTEQFPEIAKIDGAHRFAMGHVCAAIQNQIPDVQLQGICDLTWQNRKFSGNALRVTRNHVLYHGTILYAADLELVGRCLDFAPRQPEYRRGRDHESFITNVPLNTLQFAEDLVRRFSATPTSCPASVISQAERLVHERYGREDWRDRH